MIPGVEGIFPFLARNISRKGYGVLKNIVQIIQKAYKGLCILESILCAAGLFVTSLLTFFQVINRYWLHYEIIWLSDLCLFIFIAFMLLVIPLTTRLNGHTAVDVFVESVFGKRPRGRAAYNAVLKIVAIVTVAIFMYPTWGFALRAYKYPQYATLVRWFNTSWLMEMLFFSLAMCLIHLIFGFASDIANFVAMRNAGVGR